MDQGTWGETLDERRRRRSSGAMRDFGRRNRERDGLAEVPAHAIVATIGELDEDELLPAFHRAVREAQEWRRLVVGAESPQGRRELLTFEKEQQQTASGQPADGHAEESGPL